MPTDMRDSNRSTFRGRGRTLAPIVVIALIVAACGGGDATPSPSHAAAATAGPTATPDPHLPSPASLEDVFRGIQAAGLKVIANTGGTGEAGEEPVRDFSATYEGWPLIISEYSSTKALAKAKRWKRGKHPGQGEPPIAIKGSNILVEWGPTTGKKPPKLDATQQAAVAALIEALDPLLHPLTARTSVPVDIPVHSTDPPRAPPRAPVRARPRRRARARHRPHRDRTG